MVYVISGHHIDFVLPDIAVEIFQKSAPSPIRKLQKKYAAHVARLVLSIISLVSKYYSLLSFCTKTYFSLGLGRLASLRVP